MGWLCFYNMEAVTRHDLETAKSRQLYQALKKYFKLDTEMCSCTKGVAWVAGAFTALGKKLGGLSGEKKISALSGLHSAASTVVDVTSVAGIIGGTASSVSNVLSQREELEVLRTIRTFLENLRPPDVPWGDFQQVVWEVMGETLDGAVKLMMEAVPFVGLGISAVKMFRTWSNLAKAENQKRQARIGKDFVMPGGEIATALEAIEKHLAHLAKYARVDAANQSATFGAKLAGTFTDLGIVTGAAVTAASLLVTAAAMIAKVLYERKQTAILRRSLENGSLDVLVEHPLLASYVLLISDASDIINMVRAGRRRAGAVQFGNLGWKEEVEWIKPRYIDPILKSAAQIVASSNLILMDMYTRTFYLNGENGRIVSWMNIYEAEQKPV
jgi:hypothetical protein